MAKRSSQRSNKPKGSTKPTGSSKSSGGGGSSRARTRERRLERQRQRQRQQQLTILGVIAVVAVLAVIAFIFINQPAEAPIPEGVLERYEDIPQNTTEEGFSILGDTDAPVRVVEYSSFSCPGCAQFHDNWMDYLVEQVRQGVISFTYVPLTLGSIPNAEGASRAAICAGEQGAFYEYHDVLFHWHRTFGNRAFSQNRLEAGVENLGLNESQYDRCMDSGLPGDVMDAAQDDARERAVTGTPTTFINGIELGAGDLRDAVEQALAATGLTPVPLDIGEVEAPDVGEEAEATAEAEATEDAAEETETTPEASEEAATGGDDTDAAAETEAEATEVMDSAAEADEAEAEATQEADGE